MKLLNTLSSSLVVVFFLAIVGIPVVFYSGGSEPASWRIAHARNLHRTGHEHEAIQEMRDALVMAAGHPVLQMDVAKWMYRNGHAEEALELIDELIEADRQRDDTSQFGLAEKSDCLAFLARYRESLDVYVELNGEKPKNLSQRNSLAYYRGLAGVDLVLAHKDMHQVFSENEISRRFNVRDTHLSFIEKTIVAICISSQSFEHELPIIEQLDPIINQIQQAVGYSQDELASLVYRQSIEQFPMQGSQERKIKIFIESGERAKRKLAVLLTCRALLNQDLGRQEQCDQDRIAIQFLGHDPDDLVATFPSDLHCLNFLLNARAWLDTRGVIYAASQAHKLAKRDYDFAVLASELLAQHFQRNSYLNETVNVYSVKRTLATMIYHRLQLHEETGNTAAAERDRSRIESLGFEPGTGLF